MLMTTLRLILDHKPGLSQIKWSQVFNFPEDVFDSAWAQATGEEDPGSSVSQLQVLISMEH